MAVRGPQHSEHRRALHTQDPGDREGGAGGGLVWGRPFPFPLLGPSLAHTLSLQAPPRTELTVSQPSWWLPRALAAMGQVAEGGGSPGERGRLLSPQPAREQTGTPAAFWDWLATHSSHGVYLFWPWSDCTAIRIFMCLPLRGTS